MSNEAAERIDALVETRMREQDAKNLATAIANLRAAHGTVISAIEVAERRATVERIRAALQPRTDLIGGDVAWDRSEIDAILDTEAAR